EQPDHRWQLRELAARMLWSRSRLSHHLARMETRGLVTREPDPDDGRNAVVVLPDHGFATLEAAAPAHVESARRHLGDLATRDELAALAALAERVVGEVGDLT